MILNKHLYLWVPEGESRESMADESDDTLVIPF